ncbi:MAG: hypothetical protein KatS3mg113_1114 [Planctomycetaceae bacterium]|nr:MAG: hypothetical protein KatS3mg113_1114 [Planctomycetaceae bacterium]
MISEVRSCVICGSHAYRQQRVLWPELIATWQLTPAEIDLVERQQGLICQGCGSQWRTLGLAAAIMQEFGYAGLFRDFVRESHLQTLQVLEINPAGNLTTWLQELAGHQLVCYPEADMQCLPFPANEFDLVVHSDTLEHVPDPIRGLQECYRVLKPGGRCCFTVPVLVGRLTRSRAGLPASYHGSPEHPADCFVHTEFGADAWRWVLQAGFETCTVHVWEDPTAYAWVGCKAVQSASIRPADASLAQSRRRPSLSRDEVRRLWHQITWASTWLLNQPEPRTALWLTHQPHVSPPPLSSTVCWQTHHLSPQSWQTLPDADHTFRLVLWSVPTTQPHLAAQLHEILRVLHPAGLLLIAIDCTGSVESATTTTPLPPPAAELVPLLRSTGRAVGWSWQRLWNGSLVWPVEPPVPADGFCSDLLDGAGWQHRPGLFDPEVCWLWAAPHDVLPRTWGILGLPQDLSPAQRQIQMLRQQLHSLQNSRSWRLTAPLRWGAELVRRYFHIRSSNQGSPRS